MDHHDPEFLKRAAEARARITELPPRQVDAQHGAGAPVITYCNGGNRGGIGADTLQSLGYTNVFSIAGGFKAYLAATHDKER